MTRKAYPSDLSDREWQLLEPLLPPPKPRGRSIKYPRREVVNAIRYVLRTGCAWRMLPHDLPPWRTTFHYFRTWRRDGTWERVHAALRDQVRIAEGRDVSPSAAIIDSQSVKTTEKGGLVAMMLVRGCVRSLGHVLEWRYETQTIPQRPDRRTVGCSGFPTPISQDRGKATYCRPTGGRQRHCVRSAQRLHVASHAA